MSMEMEAKIEALGVVPVVVLQDAKDAVPLAKALCQGGLPCAEVTFRTAAAAESIRKMTQEFPEMLVGAGTVLTVKQVDEAVAAGAKFIVSPGFDPEIVDYCLEKGIPVFPGCITPSEVAQAVKRGLRVVKFFPAQQFGGVAAIKALAAPYVGLKFMPTGGINAKNLTSYLDFPKIIACGGSWMVPGDLINDGAWDKIEQLTREAVQTMLGFELAHIGVNSESKEEADKTVRRLAFLFGTSIKVGSGGSFAGTIVEVLNSHGRGTHGHIAIRTNYIERAINYMSTVLGAEFEAPIMKGDKINAIYLKEEIGGFAVHLLQK